MHILKIHICAFLFLHICAYFVHIYAYSYFAHMAFFRFAYFRIFTLIMPPKANINIQNCGGRATRARLLSRAVSSF